MCTAVHNTNMFLDNFCDQEKTYLHPFHISTSYECVRPLRYFELVDDFSLKLGVNILQL
jgi:hypothetical protein